MKPANKLSIKQIAAITNGTIEGNPDLMIEGANTLEYAASGDVTFLANPKYKKWLKDTSASCVLVPAGLKQKYSASLVRVERPDLAFSKVLENLYGSRQHSVKGISSKSVIDPTAIVDKCVDVGDFVKIGERVRIGCNTKIYPGVYLGEYVTIGENCIIYPNVVIMDSVNIGNNVIVHAGSVIGSDGFGYTTNEGVHTKVPQVGSVKIADNVEIGANVTIDRGSPGDTSIGEGTKIDNLVQIAHNVRIGKNCFIVSQVGIAGSAVIGDNAVLAGQAGVVGHINIGSNAKIGAQAGVTRDIKSGQLVSGYPAMDHMQAKKINAMVRKLPKLFKQVDELMKKINNE
ncbi:UDP-3-O-(3-hydroxymyristoyl)glucosamine N-acyltransferase [Elusimicrobiota bacterium]